VTQFEVEIEQLKSRNQEATAESNTYQDRITSFRNELNYECTNAEVLRAVAVASADLKQDQQ
jgi:hypothetical protein